MQNSFIRWNGPTYRSDCSFQQKPARVLQDTLHKLFDELSTRQGLGHNIDEVNLEMGSIDTDFKRKRKEVCWKCKVASYVARIMLL